MGQKHNLVHFKSLLGCLLIKSWSSSQHLHAGKQWRVIPSLPSHLVIYFTLVKWFRFGWQDWLGEILALLITKLFLEQPQPLASTGSAKLIFQQPKNVPLISGQDKFKKKKKLNTIFLTPCINPPLLASNCAKSLYKSVFSALIPFCTRWIIFLQCIRATTILSTIDLWWGLSGGLCMFNNPNMSTKTFQQRALETKLFWTASERHSFD